MHVDLDQPAELTLWPSHAPARVADTRSFPSLRAALAAAAEAIDRQDAVPWIITDERRHPRSQLDPRPRRADGVMKRASAHAG